MSPQPTGQRSGNRVKLCKTVSAKAQEIRDGLVRNKSMGQCLNEQKGFCISDMFAATDVEVTRDFRAIAETC